MEADPQGPGGAPLPPVNSNSSLVLNYPTFTSDLDTSEDFSEGSSFGIQPSERAAALANNEFGVQSSMRRNLSAPYSMTSMSAGGETSGFLAPTGEPLRRNYSTLGLRHSSSFFWTPAMHGEFEKAVNILKEQGNDQGITAAAICELMAIEGLSEGDVEKHMQKRSRIQNRIGIGLNLTPPVQQGGFGTIMEGDAMEIDWMMPESMKAPGVPNFSHIMGDQQREFQMQQQQLQASLLQQGV